MKRILAIFIALLLVFTISGCDETSDVEPTFFGELELTVKIKTGSTFNPLLGMTANADGKDLTSEIEVKIYDVNYQIYIDEIDLGMSGTYRIFYTVKNGKAVAKAERLLIVGTGEAINPDIDYDKLTYELFFEDEFEGNKLNTKYWNYETGGGGWGNNELQYYTTNEKNSTVSDGTLKINAIKESYGGREYTSARLTTAHKVDFTYGKVEASLKLPKGKGTWPAFWMMPTNSPYGPWPTCGEIDIMEHVGYNENYIVSSAHSEKFNFNVHSEKNATKLNPTATTEFHKYTLEWLPDRLRFFIDDVQFFEYIASNYVTTVDYKSWPYDNDFFIILNLAIGGNWGGAMGVDDNICPATYEIDYVRVFQAKELKK